jgi:hypothetical protein
MAVSVKVSLISFLLLLPYPDHSLQVYLLGISKVSLLTVWQISQLTLARSFVKFSLSYFRIEKRRSVPTPSLNNLKVNM